MTAAATDRDVREETAHAKAEQYLDTLLAQSREDRIRRVAAVMFAEETLELGHACWMQGHGPRLAEFEDHRKELADAISDLRATLPEMSEAARPAVEAVLNRIERIRP